MPGRPPIAVIDIGSNSGRIVAFKVHPGGHLEILADARSPLRLEHGMNPDGRLSRNALDRTVEALRDFWSVAQGSGAKRILAVATSAVRESLNGRVLVSRVRSELGIELKVIDGRREALYGFLGAVHGLPVLHGLLLDLGGGSLEITHFRRRRPTRFWTLPLGALRLSDRFLADDPPRPAALGRLRDHVEKALRKASIPALMQDEHLVATGGTIRNLAEIHRRTRTYPIASLHGYVLAETSVREMARQLGRVSIAARMRIRGLSRDRGDSIVGGAIALHLTMRAVGAPDLLVSGQGVREGLARAALGGNLPSPEQVRHSSVAALARRFRAWDQAVAERRADAAERLLATLEPGSEPELREALRHAAMLLDTGRSIDYYNRHRHAALIVSAGGLSGFSHRALALVATLLQQADNGDLRLKAYRPLLRSKDAGPISKASVLLALADELERRSPRRRPVSFGCAVGAEEIVLRTPALAAWKPRGVGDRFQKAFGRKLRVSRP